MTEETGSCGNPRASGGRSGDDLCGWFCNRSDRISWRQAAETAKGRLELLVRLWAGRGKPIPWTEALKRIITTPPPTEVMVAFDKLQGAIDESQGILGSDVELIWNTRSIVEKLASAVNHGNCAIESMISLLEQDGVKVPSAPPVPTAPSGSGRGGLALGLATFALLGVGVYYARKNYMLQEGRGAGSEE